MKLLKKMLVALSTLLILSSSIALSAEVSLLTSVGLRQEYNDNILYTRSNEIDDFISYAIPSLDFDYRTEIFNISALAKLEGLLYWDNSDLNTINQRYELSSTYRLTERWSVSAEGFYIGDTTLDSQLEETGIVGVRQDRDRFNAGAGLDYALSERINVGSDYSFQKTNYERRQSTDTEIHTVRAYYRRRLKNEIDVISLFPRVNYATSDDYDAYSSTLNVEGGNVFLKHLTR